MTDRPGDEGSADEPEPSGAASTGAPDAASAPAGRRKLDPDALAALIDERDFLLRSLDDLEREHDAGDVDDGDYETLKDDYTARAARAIRAIESHHARARVSRRPRSWRRVAATVAGVVAFAVLAGALVAQASGRRGSGDALTGDIRQSTREELAEALELASEGDYDAAIDIYDDVLADDPDNAEALTYRGWFLFLEGDAAGIESLRAAIEADPDYPPVNAFLAVVLERAGRPDTALEQLDRFESLDPPPYLLELTVGMRERLEAEVGADGTPSTSAPTTP